MSHPFLMVLDNIKHRKINKQSTYVTELKSKAEDKRVDQEQIAANEDKSNLHSLQKSRIVKIIIR
jgi:hypothetical protein